MSTTGRQRAEQVAKDYIGSDHIWWAKLAEEFGDRLPVVQDVYDALHKFGIYYYALAPRNVNFENHPDDCGARLRLRQTPFGDAGIGSVGVP
jgi:hypothetical protein